MAKGDFLIYRNNSSTATLPNTGSNLDSTWDTDVNGKITTNFRYTNNQPVSGKVRRATTGTKYITSSVSATITSSGLNSTVFMVTDE